MSDTQDSLRRFHRLPSSNIKNATIIGYRSHAIADAATDDALHISVVVCYPVRQLRW